MTADGPTTPPRRSLLERSITKHTSDTGIAAKRIRHWISSMVILGALDRVRTVDDSHQFVIKGGVALEIRLGLSARATRDVDMTFHGNPTQLAATLDEALAQPYGGFSFNRSDLIPIDTTGAQRTTIKMTYGGKGWMTVDLELTVDGLPTTDIELLPAISVTDFQLEGPSHVATLSLRYQIAQKLHAVTETFDDRDNSRVRDIIDLVLLSDLAPETSSVQAACIDVFTERSNHTWPPELAAHDSWPSDYADLVDELAIPAPSFEEAITRVRNYIREIAAAG